MPRRVRRRGLGMVGTAAVVGGAAYAGNKSGQAKAQSAAGQQQIEAQLAAQQQQLDQQATAQQQPAAAPAAAQSAATGGMSPDDLARLEQLGNLNKQGILSDEEFSQAKARILGF